MADLDNLLDDIEIENEGADVLDAEFNTHDLLPWTDSVENVPEDLRSRWSRCMAKDAKKNRESSLQLSELYRSWDGQPPSHQSVAKILQDAVRNACLRCSFDEKKTSALLSITNALELGPGRALQLAYSKQIIRDLRKICNADPNFDESRFASLALQLRE